MKWCVLNSFGAIEQVGFGGLVSRVEDLAHIPGDKILDVPDYVDYSTHYFRDGAFREYGIKPTETHKWDWNLFTWVEDSVTAAASVRARRDVLLDKTDWTQLPDVPLATKSAWATYRQALRDVTAQPGFPLDITWPAPPG